MPTLFHSANPHILSSYPINDSPSLYAHFHVLSIRQPAGSGREKFCVLTCLLCLWVARLNFVSPFFHGSKSNDYGLQIYPDASNILSHAPCSHFERATNALSRSAASYTCPHVGFLQAPGSWKSVILRYEMLREILQFIRCCATPSSYQHTTLQCLNKIGVE